MDKIFIIDSDTSVSIDLVDYESYLTLSLNGNVLNKKFKTNFDYIYSEDLDRAISKIKLFSSSNNKVKVLMLPSATEEFPTFSLITFDTSGLLESYLIEIRDFTCSNFNKMVLSDNTILVKNNNDKTCDTHLIEENTIVH